MSPERIRLFPLVSVLTLSPSFDTSISINTTLPPFYRFLCVSLTVSHIALNQSAASIENVRIFNNLYQGYSN